MSGVPAFLRETAWVAYAIYFRPTALEAHLRARLRDVERYKDLTRLHNIVNKLDQPAARRYLAQLALLCALAAAPLWPLALLRAADLPGPGALALTWLLLALGSLGLTIDRAARGPLTGLSLAGLVGSLPQPAAWLNILQSEAVRAALSELLWPVLPLGLLTGLSGGWGVRFLIRRGWPEGRAVVAAIQVAGVVAGVVAVGVAVVDVAVVDVAIVVMLFVPIVVVAGVAAVVVGGVALFVATGVTLLVAGGLVVGVAVGVAGGLALLVAAVVAFLVAGGLAVDVAGSVAGGLATALRRRFSPAWAEALAAGAASASAGPLAAAWAALAAGILLNITPRPLPLLAWGALALGLAAGSLPWRGAPDIFDLAFLGLGAGFFITLSDDTAIRLWPHPAAVVVWLGAWGVGFTRLPLYVWHAIGLWLARRRLALNSAPVFAPWRRDELIAFPLPALADYLARFTLQQRDLGLQLIEEAAASWRQAGPAQRALLQLAAAALARYDSEAAMARADSQLDWLPPTLPASVQATLGRFRAVSRLLDDKLKLSDDEAQLRQLARATAELDDLIKGLTFVPRRERELFLPVAHAWREVARRASTRLPNPYIAGDPVSDDLPGLFVGRDDVVRELESQLKNRSRRPALVLYGQRRMGKTSLLYQLPRRFGPETAPVRIDCQAPEMQESNGAFLFHLARAIHQQTAAQRGLALPPLPAGVEMPSFTAFALWLEAVEAQLEGRVLLLCLDEYEKLGEAIQQGHLDTRILDLLRNLIQHHPAITLLLAGSHHPAELGAPWSSYVISAAVLPISYLPPDETRRLITQPIPGFPLRYSLAAVEHILALTRCQPLLVQLLCQHVVMQLNRRGVREADVADIEAAIPDALTSGGSLYFIYLRQYDAAGAGDALLRDLAQRGPGAAMSATALTQGDPARAQALATLLRRDILEEVGGQIRFEIELVRRWWANDHMSYE